MNQGDIIRTTRNPIVAILLDGTVSCLFAASTAMYRWGLVMERYLVATPEILMARVSKK